MKTFYLKNDHWIFGNFAAKNYGPITFIKIKYKNDVGLYNHEETHYNQWKRHPILMPILYKLSRNHRLMYEIEAYINQLLCYNVDLRKRLVCKFVMSLYKNYKLNIPYNDILYLFNCELNKEI